MAPKAIPIAQIESGLEGDGKFLRLRVRTAVAGDTFRYYAALGAWLSITLAAWRGAKREPDRDILAMIPDELVRELHAADLLADDFGLTQEAFDHWPGRVLQARADDAARKAEEAANRRNRSAGLRAVPGEASGNVGTPAASGDSSFALLSSSLDSLGGESAERGGEPDARFATEEEAGEHFAALHWLAAHGAGDVGPKTEATLATMLGRWGLPAVLQAFAELAETGKVRGGSQYVYGAKRRLEPIPDGPSSADRKAEEAAAERSRAADATRRRQREEQDRRARLLEADAAAVAGGGR